MDDLTPWLPVGQDDAWRAGPADATSKGTVDYRGWLIGVINWDGVLPICVVALPQIAMAYGAKQSVTESLSIAAPVLAFFVRMYVGYRRIAANHCGPLLRCAQFAVFFLTAMYLVCLDTVVLITLEMRNGRLVETVGELGELAVLFSFYFFGMLLALYPGRSPGRAARSEGPDTVNEYDAVRRGGGR